MIFIQILHEFMLNSTSLSSVVCFFPLIYVKPLQATVLLLLIAACNHYSNNYTPGIYAEGYIVFVFPFVRSYFLPSRGIYVKVLR